MRTALLLPGQGAIEPGLGRAFLREDAHAKQLLRIGSDLTGVDLKRALTRGGAALSRTDVVQPLLAAISLAAWRACERSGVHIDAVAGHSFGDLMALGIAAGIDDEQIVALAVARGRLFARQAELWPGGMLALTTTSGFNVADQPAIEALIVSDPNLALAAINAPTEWVLSGRDESLEGVRARFGGRLLDVGGPWHHPELRACAEGYRKLLAEHIPGAELRTPLISCIDGAVLVDGTEAIDRVAAQCIAPVRWDKMLKTLRADGTTHVICSGAGRVLRGLVRLNSWRDVQVLLAVDPRSVATSAAALRPAGPKSR